MTTAAAPPGAPAGLSGKRAQTKAQNRAAILDAAREVFSELGYGAAGVREVVRRTGLAPGTFYNYFPDKEAVFRALVDEFAHEVQARMREARARATTAEEFVHDGFLAFFEFIAENPEMFRLVRRNAGTIPVITEDPVLGAGVTDLERDLGAAVERGDLPPHDLELMSGAMAGAGLEIAARMLERAPVDPEGAARLATAVFMGGYERLGTPRLRPR